MSHPDFLQAFFAAKIVDGINKDNPDYQPFFPDTTPKEDDPLAALLSQDDDGLDDKE
jgi:hypothetical protein